MRWTRVFYHVMDTGDTGDTGVIKKESENYLNCNGKYAKWSPSAACIVEMLVPITK